jgi:hypothetical protein
MRQEQERLYGEAQWPSFERDQLVADSRFIVVRSGLPLSTNRPDCHGEGDHAFALYFVQDRFASV